MSNKYNQPLLDHDTDDESSEEITPVYSTHNSRILKASLIANLLLLVICAFLSGTLLFISSSKQSRKNALTDDNLEPYSPANDFIEYEYRRMVTNDTRFTGFPGPEWERSMHELLSGTLIRISDDELKLLNSDSIPLMGGGYAAGLGVGHNLHCVKQVKRFIYREHFYSEMDPSSEEYYYLQTHADHCLDFLRQSIMCHLDFTMYTVYWDKLLSDKPIHHEPGLQKCVSWDKLHDWMLERQANTDMLIEP
ncbi:uncharacterized protein F4822DRAFT_443966 [Hypoxylon trugodes]|uniref:uncharacterized protein n=1 Tax=Hypoxylon trugodes TaxID=326681 RepID=UPI00219694CF|nr:uncharacterized protein F4822DRAFT_443966 [Hypoxylon trugodes]KAI1387154.1 hypothetical protein F4822DRAFT_443966 [Hypoxylon trugodes]